MMVPGAPGAMKASAGRFDVGIGLQDTQTLAAPARRMMLVMLSRTEETSALA